uniref:Uncharacterized protein n=1 Tax=uncultured Thiotrichaceae bacterium TaxID=298394 RepID=A0A6S6UL20_9GAMM|nr:MAG: Unknown protein [uncultured Thiotrichaceae bacterium]
MQWFKLNQVKKMTYHAFVHGLLGWGLPMFLVMTFVVPALEGGDFSALLHLPWFPTN